MKNKIPEYIKKEHRWGYIFIVPPFIQLLLFGLIPIVFSIYASFTNWNVLSDIKFLGLENYKELFSDTKFWKALFNTLYYFIGIPIGMAFALLIALMVKKDNLSNKVFRVLYYIPAVSSIVAVSIMWMWIYNPDYGILNGILKQFGIKGLNWLSDPNLVKPSLIAMGVWGGLGPSIIMFMASLKNIPKDYYEAADIDGAGKVMQFFKITFPLMTPLLFYFFILGFISNMQAFGNIYVMLPGGGPEYSGASLVFYLWQKGFTNFQLGYACSVAWILAIITFIVTFIQFKYQNRWVYSQ